MSGLEIESTGSLLTSYNGDTIDNTMWDANYNGELMNIETIHNDDYTNIQMDNNDISRLFNNIGLMKDSSIENRLQNDYNKQEPKLIVTEPKQEPKQEPKFIVIEPNYHMKKKSSIKNKKSSLKNKKSSLKNKKSSLKNKKLSLKNKKSSLKNKKSSLKNKKSSLKNKKSSLKNKKSSTRKNIKLNSSDILNTIY